MQTVSLLLLYVFLFFSFNRNVIGADFKPKNEFEKNLLALLTKWRSGDMQNFLVPMPTLDKITLPAVSGDYDGHGVRFSYSTTNLILTGLNLLSVEQLDIAVSNLSALLKVPSLSVAADRYKINGRVLKVIPIIGSGFMNVTFNKIDLRVSIQMRSNVSQMWMENFALSFQLGSITADLKGGPRAVTLLLNSSGVAIVQSYHDDIVKAVRELAVPAINKFLAGNNIRTTAQLLGLVDLVQTAYTKCCSSGSHNLRL
ncbi:hypothetical protein ACJJTC_007850 [Scirpophaga incertulas]